MKRRKPETFNERLAYVTGFLVCWGKKEGKPPDAIRLDVHKVLQEAFDRSGIRVETVEIDGKPEEVVTFPGLFMMVFDNEYDQVNYRDPATQERITQVVDKAITYSLNNPGQWARL